MNRSFQIFKTRFQMNLKFNLPPSKVILPEKMSADLRVIPSQLREIPPHPRGGGLGMSVITLQTIFFGPINLKKKSLFSYLPTATSKSSGLLIAPVNKLS